MSKKKLYIDWSSTVESIKRTDDRHMIVNHTMIDNPNAVRLL